jgi:hypothetical protein
MDMKSCLFKVQLAAIYASLYFGLFSDSKKGKAVMKAEPTREINPDCANASNPYHKCGEYCKRNGNR